MDYVINTRECAAHRMAVRDIPKHEIGFARDPVGLPVRVDALLQKVEDADVVATLEQQVDSVRPDEPGTPGD